MYYKKPRNDWFELVAVLRIHVLEENRAGDFEVRFELADGQTLNRVYTSAEFSDLLADPPSVIL